MAAINAVQGVNDLFPVLHGRHILSATAIGAQVKKFGAGLEELVGDLELHGKEVRRKKKTRTYMNCSLQVANGRTETLEALPVRDGNQISCERHVQFHRSPPAVARITRQEQEAHANASIQCRVSTGIKPSCLKQ